MSDKSFSEAGSTNAFPGGLAAGVTVDKTLSVIGRLALCYLFCTAAFYHLTFGRQDTVRDMVTHHVPLAGVLNVVAMLLSSILSIALLFNFRTRWAALGLALYTVVVSTVMYGPLNADWGMTRVLFMKDMAIFGALLAWSRSAAVQRR